MSKLWRSRNIGVAGLLTIVVASTLDAGETLYQDTEALKTAVREAILAGLETEPYSNLEISVRSVDNRLRLKACDRPLDTTVTNPSQKLGRLTTEVSCNSSSPWKIYVQATATAEMLVPVLARSLSRGSLVGPDDVFLKSVPVGLNHQPIIESKEALIGMEVRRSLSSGQPVQVSQVIAPNLIKRGQKVNIRYGETDLQITMAGKALQNGAQGEWVPVENTSSGRRIEGRVEKDGTIMIPSY